MPVKMMESQTSPPKSSGCWTGPRKEIKWEKLERRESKSILHGNIQSRTCSLLTRRRSVDLIKDFEAPLILAAWNVHQRSLQGRICNAIVNDLPSPRLF